MVQRLWPHEVLVILNVSSRYRSFFDNKRIHSCISRTSSPSRVPSGQLCMTSKTKIQAWKAVPTALRRAGLPGQSGIGGASTAASEEHVHAHTRACSPECACLSCLYTYGLRKCADSTSMADLLGAGRGRGTCTATIIIRDCFGCCSAGWQHGWKDCRCCWLALGLLAMKVSRKKY